MVQIAFYVFSPYKDENVNLTPWLSVVILNLFVLWVNPKTTVSIGFEMRLPWLFVLLRHPAAFFQSGDQVLFANPDRNAYLSW